MTPVFGRKRAVDEGANAVNVDPRPIPLCGIDHIELFVGNVRHTAAYLVSTFGFQIRARQGPDTGVQDLVSAFLVQGQARLLLTGGLTSRHDAAVHVLEHGDSVKDVALSVEDMDATYLGLRERGIEPLHLPVDLEDETGRMWICPIQGIGPVLHTFVDRSEYGPWPAPGFVAVDPGDEVGGTGIHSIDTVSMVVQPGTLDDVSRRYRSLLGAERTLEAKGDVTSTDGFSFRAVTFVRPDLRLRLVEPDRRVRRSHLDEFLRLHGGPGVHTITFRSSDLDRTVRRLRAAHVGFIDHRDATTAAAGSGLPIRSDEADGSRVRHAVTEAFQDRTPLHFEFVEGDSVSVTPLASIRAMHATLEGLHRRLDHPLLPRESAGR